MKDVIDEAYPLKKGTDFLKRERLKKALSDRFTQGFICACANILRNHGDTMTTEEVLGSIYTSIADLKKCNVEESDIKILMPIIKNIERKKKNQYMKSHSNNQISSDRPLEVGDILVWRYHKYYNYTYGNEYPILTKEDKNFSIKDDNDERNFFTEDRNAEFYYKKYFTLKPTEK